MSSQDEILLAEDEEHIAKLVSFKLGREGHSVTVARDGGEAVLQAGARRWSLIILDVMMPVHDGWHVLRCIRQPGSPNAAIPVLMLTAKSHQKDMADAAELGATRFLKKPFDPGELAGTVRQMLEGAGGGAMTGWDSDPELRVLRTEFVQSFEERRKKLRAAGGSRDEVRELAHRLAGAAESYGFPTITRISGALDDLISAGHLGPAELGDFCELLGEALERAARSGQDPSELGADPRFAALTSEAGSLASEASS